MAKGIPSFPTWRCFGIDIITSPATTSSSALRVIPRSASKSILPAVLTRQYAHSQRVWQTLDRNLQFSQNSTCFSRPTYRNATVYSNSLTGRSAVSSCKSSTSHRTNALLNWIQFSRQQRFFSDGKDDEGAKCACGKERPDTHSQESKHVSDPRKAEATSATDASQKPSKQAPENARPNVSEEEAESIATSMSKYLHLPHLPRMPHRPTKEELLDAANGFWQRMKVRLKWVSIRSMRPWNADEWGAFVSWFMLGHLVWILVGTTTFFSLIIFSFNTVFAQGEVYSLY